MVNKTNTIQYQCYDSNKRQAGKRREEEEEKEKERNFGSQGCAAARGRQPKIPITPFIYKELLASSLQYKWQAYGLAMVK